MTANQIQQIISYLQDGYIEEMSLDGNTLNIKIECKHLAHYIQPEFNFFYVVIKGLEDFYFLPWDDEEMKINSIKDIQLLKPDILKVDVEENGYVKIYSNCEHVYSGGCFYLKADAVLIFDEALNALDTEQLDEISDKFWMSENNVQ